MSDVYRVGIVTKTGRIEAKTFSTRDEADEYLLIYDDKEGLLRFRIELNNVVIETEGGKR